MSAQEKGDKAEGKRKGRSKKTSQTQKQASPESGSGQEESSAAASQTISPSFNGGPGVHHLSPFPCHPSPFMMNPGYGSPPPPGSPYNSQSAQPAGYPPHMQPQAYPYPFPPLGYPYQYAPGMMMYPMQPRAPPDDSHHGTQSPASASAPAESSTTLPAGGRKTTGKRKRSKADSGREDEDDASEDDDSPHPPSVPVAMIAPVPLQAPPAPHPPAPTSASIADSRKRTKTQRACDSCRSRKIRCDVVIDSEPPICQHCKQYAFECTFFLPITETRFKKKKGDQEDAPAPTKPGDLAREVGVFGPTSEAHLLHSQATVSSRMYESYDLRYQHTWDVTTTGDGLITVQKPHADDQNSASALRSSKPSETRVERDVVESLLNSYFTNVAPLLPVITQSEFLSSEKPPPTILLYSMCLVAAARRDVPQHVFDSIRHAVNHVIKVEDVLSSASIVNLQSLLILSMCGDSHSQFVPTALSALWIRLGTAIRMAQDLGLHRAESVRKQIEVRRRIWGACVISDRWTSLIYGHPYMIDVQDCDVRLPSSGDPNDLYMDELVRLSVILGRVLKTIYSPSGLAFTTDEMLYDIFEDLQGWKKRLPAHLAYHGPDTPESAGLLHLLYACVSMIFWRVFMRISYLCPAHIKFGLTVEQWTALVQLTGEGIDWLDRHEKMYDVWLIVAYAATSCALVQYHTWARRKDDDAAAKLRKLRDCVRRWEGSISPDHMSARRKTAEIIALLYEATQGSPPVVTEAPALNPTGGVVGKHPIRMTYKKDPSRPGGGVFVADDEAELQDAHNLEPGTVITKDEAYRHANTQDNEERRAEGDWSENTSSGNGGSVVARRLMRPMNREYLDREFLLSSSSFAPPLEEQLPFNNNSPSGQHPQSAARAGDSNAHNMIQFTPLVRRGAEQAGDGIMNVNPAMNTDPDLMGGNVQVMNLLDSAPPPHIPVTSGAFDQLVHADNFLDGLPGGMFDWGQWDHFFQQQRQQAHAHPHLGQ